MHGLALPALGLRQSQLVLPLQPLPGPIPRGKLLTRCNPVESEGGRTTSASLHVGVMSGCVSVNLLIYRCAVRVACASSTIQRHSMVAFGECYSDADNAAEPETTSELSFV